MRPLIFILSSIIFFSSCETLDFNYLQENNGLPILHINTEAQQQIVSKNKYVQANLFFDGLNIFDDFETYVQIKLRGNSTFVLEKKPYTIKFYNDVKWAGMPIEKSWVLLAHYVDRTGIRTDLAFDLSRMSGLEFTPKTQQLELYVNNKYMGTYLLVEKIKIADNRVNVTDDGYLLELDDVNQLTDKDVWFRSNRGLVVNIKDPGILYETNRFYWIQNHINKIEDVLYSDNFKDPINGYVKYIDVLSFVDWYLINEISKNNDAKFYKSCYMNIVPNGKLKMGPVWDFDIAFGNTLYNDCDKYDGFYIKDALWLQRLFEDPNFVELVKQRFLRFKSNMPLFLNSIESNASLIEQSMNKNDDKWHILNNKPLQVDKYLQYPGVGTYNDEVNRVKNFLIQRMQWLEQAYSEL